MSLAIKFFAVLPLLFIAYVGSAAEDFDLVAIPTGTAVLGDPEGDDNEIERSVHIPAFRLMRREVTNRQFTRFVDDSGYRTTVENTGKGNVWWLRWRLIDGADWRHPAGPKSNLEGLLDHPTVQVSALDGEAFCQFYGMRLPSEDEWEYAARGPQGYRYAWGNTLTRDTLAAYVNAGSFDCCAASAADGFSRTAPVGSFPLGRSPFGLDDMTGNVWEWTSSPFPGAAEKRAIRGGGWGNNPYCLKTAYRHGNPPHIGLNIVGIRCAAP